MQNKSKFKKLYLEKFHIDNRAKLIPFANYMMPINYSGGIISEHLKTRSNAGLFDVSHMLQVDIPANIEIINKLENIIPLDLKNLDIGKSNYSFILNENGGVIDDLIISKLKNENGNIFFYIVLNASRKEIDIKILSEVLGGGSNIINQRNNFCLLALQGPESRKILSEIFPEIIDLKFMEIKRIYYNNYDIIISCSGYTGEDGFELSINNNVVYNILDKLMEYENVSLCGLGSRDTLRLEASLSLYGNELNETITPKEASLMWAISKNRKKEKNFKGADTIFNSIKNPEKIRIGIETSSNVIPRHDNNLFDNQNNLIGIVTSGSYSPSLKKPIAMGIVNIEYSKVGTNILFESRGIKNSAIVTKLPFVKHKYKK